MVAPERETPGIMERPRQPDDQVHRQREQRRFMVARLEIEPIDPKEHDAADDQRDAYDPRIEQHLLDEPVGRRPRSPPGRNAISTPMTKRRAYEIVEYADSELPRPHGIDRQPGQDGAELDQNREALAESSSPKPQQKMARRGDRQKTRSTPRSRRGWLPNSGCADPPGAHPELLRKRIYASRPFCANWAAS
jgi:hypothetical protein